MYPRACKSCPAIGSIGAWYPPLYYTHSRATDIVPSLSYLPYFTPITVPLKPVGVNKISNN